MRIVSGAAMKECRIWVRLVTLQTLLLAVSCGHHLRRSMTVPSSLPVSKGGWRPVISSGLQGYGPFQTAPLHAPAYKVPIPVQLDSYPSSSRPVSARETNKLTSIAQSYRPTTIRTTPTSPAQPNSPVSSYFNPFGTANNGLTHYKFVQNFPTENIVIRNPQSPYAARPVYTKHQNKYKQVYHPIQHMSNLQFNIPYGYKQQPHDYNKQQDHFNKPVEMYARPLNEGKRPQTNNVEMFKPEVYKVDSETAPQSVSQQVKTAQQQSGSYVKPPVNGFPAYQFKDEKYAPIPPSLLGTFSSFGVQSMKVRDPVFPAQPSKTSYPPQPTKTTFPPQQTHAPNKNTIFNSFNFNPNFKTSTTVFGDTTQKNHHVFNQVNIEPSNDLKYTTQQPKLSNSGLKKDSILGGKGTFKPSPQDPFSKQFPTADINKIQVSTYKPHLHSSVTSYFTSNFHHPSSQYQQQQQNQQYETQKPNQQYQSQSQNQQYQTQQQNQLLQPQQQSQQYQQPQQQQNQQYQPQKQQHYQPQQPQPQQPHKQQSQYQQSHENTQSPYYDQPTFQQEKKKHKNLYEASVKHHSTSTTQFPKVFKKKPERIEPTQNSISRPATYEVTENFENDDVTFSSASPWVTQDYEDKERPSFDSISNLDNDNIFGRLTTTTSVDLPEDYAIVTEGDKGYDNSLTYDSRVENQSREPLGDDFEPINKHKLDDYYHIISTPAYDDYTTHYILKKPTEVPEAAVTTGSSQEVSTTENYLAVKPLPTLPPSRHFKRPSSAENVEKDKIKKRIKNRRRRPPLANINRDRDSNSQKYQSSTKSQNGEESHTLRPRVRVHKLRPNNYTTPTITTDLSTSAIPTISPTAPTVVKKKISRRPVTTTERPEPTTVVQRDNDINKESPIMKIATRQHPRITTTTFDYKPTTETPDYSHKQDEKDTPTSDILLSLGDSVRHKPEKQFSFHRDSKPLEAKLEPLHHSQFRDTTTDGFTRAEEEELEITTYAPRLENTESGKDRSRLKSKYENHRPKFSVKEYRNRMSSTTSTEKPQEPPTPKIRFPTRRLPFDKFTSDSDNSTDRKKFTPKDPRHKTNENETIDKEVAVSSTRPPIQRQRPSSNTEEEAVTTQKISSRIRSSSRRPKPTEEAPESSSPTTVHIRRPLRKKIKDSEIGETVQDIAVTESNYQKDSTADRSKSESAIMKIAKDDKKHHADHIDLFEHSKRVSDLTLAASKDYNKPGVFKTVSSNSRRIPNYFTIATDDPILPIEAFFPQLNQKKDPTSTSR